MTFRIHPESGDLLGFIDFAEDSALNPFPAYGNSRRAPTTAQLAKAASFGRRLKRKKPGFFKKPGFCTASSLREIRACYVFNILCSTYFVWTVPATKLGSRRIRLASGIVVFTPSITNSSSARRQVAIASARVGR